MKQDILNIWNIPVSIQPNNFKFKSLSDFSCNIALGCSHACRFCYVPDVSTLRMASLLQEWGVTDPDVQWGRYVFPRPWQESTFKNSVRKANDTPKDKLSDDGNRAVMLCTTTDPFMVVTNKDAALQKKINDQIRSNTANALKFILQDSTLNVRILTRSPLARTQFDVMKQYGKRLMFGMSLPTLNDRLARIYEPNAPSPSKRLECLHAAKAAGLHVYVAVAPVYPECDAMDMHKTLQAIKTLNPETIFMEPINIRAENVERINEHAKTLGMAVKTEVFATKESWAKYAYDQLELFEALAHDNKVHDRLHLWPDAGLKKFGTPDDLPWLNKWWKRVSEWPK